MRSMMPLLALLLMGGSGAARALSAMPMPTGNENPYPYIFAFFIMFSLIYFAYLAADWLTWRVVRRMRESHDVEGLIRALKSAWLASKAAHVLGDIRDARAVEPLVEALDDSSDEVRQAAAKALGDIGDDRAVEPLTQALDDRYRGVRDCASYALHKIRKPCDSP
jgi:HEAT repeat protein